MWSRIFKRCFPYFVACSLLTTAYLFLSAFRKSVADPNFDVFRLSRLQTLMKRSVQFDGTISAAFQNGENIWRNSATLPDDCFNSLLRSVDPTCDLGNFCTESWRQEDVLCFVYFHQAALVPCPAQCNIVLDHQDTVDNHHSKNIRQNQTINARDSENNKNENPPEDAAEDRLKAKHSDSFKIAIRNKLEFRSRDVEKYKDVKQNDVMYKNKEMTHNEKVNGEPNNGHESQHKLDHDNNPYKVQNRVVVPRIAYYVLVSESCRNPYRFQFLHYLSMRSVKRFLRPRAIYVLGNCVPIGYWWSRAISDIKTVRFVYRPRPLVTKDGKVEWISHLSDVIRLQVLLMNGGVYLDTDMILLRSLDPLLEFPLTMGLVDNITGMGNAFMLATRGSNFLRKWYSGYKDFRPNHFHYNGMWAALHLWQADPGSVHLESKRLYSPNWYEAHLLFGNGTNYDLSDSYAVHVWHRGASVPTEPEQFLTLNSTLGKVFRRVYFGD